MKPHAICLVVLAVVLISSALSSYAQENNDHDLIRDGDPVPGMSAQQEKRSTATQNLEAGNRQDHDADRVPLLTEPTLTDDSFDSWRAGDAFLTPKPDQPTDSIKVIELPDTREDKKP